MRIEWPERLNIADHFLDQRIAEGIGDRTALRLPDGERTYEEVRALAHRYGNVLRGMGVRREERVMLVLPDGVDFVGAFFGVLEIGAVVVMVNPAFKAANLAQLFDYTGARLAVVDGAVLSTVEEALGLAEHQPELLLVGAAPPQETAAPLQTFGALSKHVPDRLETVRTHRDDPAIWLFSGGTTGRPKAVVQTHRSFANTTELYAKRTLGYGPEDITMSVPKLFFGYATGSNLLFPFSVGGSAVLFPEHPTPEVLFEKIARHRPTILINVPKMIQAMTAHPDADGHDLSCLRFATSAGEALPVPLYERWKETFGVELLDGLGTAEQWHVFVTNKPGDVRPGTLGTVVEGFELRVRDDEGRDVPDGEVGRMWVRGGSRAIAYWRNQERTEEAFRGEWFVGGDLVRKDADGTVHYCGRGDDVLKVSGKWLAPQEVESCIMKHAAVQECAVVGVEDADGLTKPYAFVVASPDGGAADGLEDSLREHCLERLDAYKHPRRVIVLAEMPRTHLGKIDRGALKKLGQASSS